VAAKIAAMNTGSRVRVIPADVSDQKQVEAMVEQSIAELGSVDVLVNNVGWTIDRLFLDKPREEHEKEVRVNLWDAITDS
jgi:NAD(P)-dependent dehydrogenase (short-subunit alcohol dehydrogenase family)